MDQVKFLAKYQTYWGLKRKETGIALLLLLLSILFQLEKTLSSPL
jgi:hypothetical protein